MEISPQAWGCTDFRSGFVERWWNLPTSVGMYRRGKQAGAGQGQSPHKRGDVPYYMNGGRPLCSISPQAWGCTAGSQDIRDRHRNLPTSVGMYRFWVAANTRERQSPHKRGDVPRVSPDSLGLGKISPQAWGCTVVVARPPTPPPNLPTSVGMYRRSERVGEQ